MMTHTYYKYKITASVLTATGEIKEESVEIISKNEQMAKFTACVVEFPKKQMQVIQIKSIEVLSVAFQFIEQDGKFYRVEKSALSKAA